MLSKSRYITQADLEGTLFGKHHHLPQGGESPKTQQRKHHLNEAAQDDEWTKAASFWQAIVRWRVRWMRLNGWRGVEENTNEEEELQNEEGMG